MNCDQTRDMLSELIDGALDEPTEAHLRKHLDQCPACRKELASLRHTISLLSGLQEVEPPTDLLPKIHAKLATARPRGIMYIFTHPELRVAAAAAGLVSVCVYGYISVNREPPTRTIQIPESAAHGSAVEAMHDTSLAPPADSRSLTRPDASAGGGFVYETEKKQNEMRKGAPIAAGEAVPSKSERNGAIWTARSRDERTAVRRRAKSPGVPSLSFTADSVDVEAEAPMSSLQKTASPKPVADELTTSDSAERVSRSQLMPKPSAPARRLVRPTRNASVPLQEEADVIQSKLADSGPRPGADDKEGAKLKAAGGKAGMSFAQSPPTLVVTSEKPGAIEAVLSKYHARNKDLSRASRGAKVAAKADVAPAVAVSSADGKRRKIVIHVLAKDYPEMVKELLTLGKLSVEGWKKAVGDHTGNAIVILRIHILIPAKP